MQQFHQTRFIRKTFCQRLIERCQTESMLPGLCQHSSAIWIFRVFQYFVVDSVFPILLNLSGLLTGQNDFAVYPVFRFLNSYFLTLNSLRKPALSLM